MQSKWTGNICEKSSLEVREMGNHGSPSTGRAAKRDTVSNNNNTATVAGADTKEREHPHTAHVQSLEAGKDNPATVEISREMPQRTTRRFTILPNYGHLPKHCNSTHQGDTHQCQLLLGHKTNHSVHQQRNGYRTCFTDTWKLFLIY